MPRKARKDTDGKFFHVMVQGIGKEYIFPDDDCKGYYLSCLKKSKTKLPAKILAYCVMGNHAHVLVSVQNAQELALFLRQANGDYARYYNNTRNRVGYVFRDRYRSEVIQDERYLIHCVAYIHNNPLKAGLVERAENYKYSSYVNYLTKKGMVDFDEAAKLFDTSERSMRAIMLEKTGANWLEHDDKEYEDKHKVLTELIKKYNISSKASVRNEELAKALTMELQERSGVSLREVAILLEVSREWLRRVVSTPPSP
ncbi:MAG: transposase [Firmicutes bacterium]|nr:transposase [Bacillota bacterium]